MSVGAKAVLGSVLILVSVCVCWSAVEFGGELRLRPEFRTNPDFNKDTHESQSFVGSRIRITGTGQAADGVSVKVTFQDSRLWGGKPEGATGLTDSGEAVDIHEGYVEFHHFAGLPFQLRAGRQKLSFGDQRLIGSLNWSHQGRAFDAFRLTFTRPWFLLDVFTAKRQENNGDTPAPRRNDKDLSGIYTTWKKAIPSSDVDIYFLHDREGRANSAIKSKNIYTVGGRVAGAVAGVDFSAEAPFQFGDAGTVVGASSAPVKVSAYAVAVKSGYTFSGAHKIRFGVEYNMASGDDDAGDTTARTFNNLYPTNHGHYGFMDQQGWRNMKAWNLSLGARPTSRTTALVSVWDFRLARKQDGWFNAAGAASGSLRAASSANTESHVGREVNLLWRFQQTPAVSWEAGVARFFAGDVIDRRVARSGDSHWGYVMSAVKF